MFTQPNSKFVAVFRMIAGITGVTGWMVAASARAGEWPCWRGPRGDGVSEETKVPVRWSGTENGRGLDGVSPK
jgi:hypothetical protein